MKALITGGAGFIGSHLADKLIGLDYSVTVLDDLSTGTIDNIRHLNDCSGFRFFEGSILDKTFVDHLVDDADVVFHLAASVGMKRVIDRPINTILTNTIGTSVLLESTSRHQTPIVLASSSEVYGKSHSLPFKEDSDVVFGSGIDGRWVYACSKFSDEHLALSYNKSTGLPVVIARLFNTVGSRQTGKYGMVLPTFVEQAQRGDPITVYGDGEQRRCFMDVRDTVEALYLLFKFRAFGEIVNVGNDTDMSINELAKLVKRVVGSASKLEYVKYEDAYGVERFDDLIKRKPDITKLKALTGFTHTIGIEDTIKFILENDLH